MGENEIGTRVIQASIEIHRELGPGLLESVYEVVLARELTGRGLKVARQVPVPIEYKGIRFDEGFRADLIIEDKVILELKSVEHVSPAHKKQVQTYPEFASWTAFETVTHWKSTNRPPKVLTTFSVPMEHSEAAVSFATRARPALFQVLTRHGSGWIDLVWSAGGCPWNGPASFRAGTAGPHPPDR